MGTFNYLHEFTDGTHKHSHESTFKAAAISSLFESQKPAWVGIEWPAIPRGQVSISSCLFRDCITHTNIALEVDYR